METKGNHTPMNYVGVIVSSTFADLKEHRAELLKALRKEKLFGIGMEDYVVRADDDVVSSSLNMVRESSAYIGLISRRYGQIPECSEKNPKGFSITRLEFEEAQKLGIPTLVFIMGASHVVKEADIELDPKKRQKLEEFRVRAKQGRIYVEFESLEHFTKQAIHAVAKLSRLLYEQGPSNPTHSKASTLSLNESNYTPIPSPPALYAEPPYIGSNQFIGRRSQLDTLDDWANRADPHAVLLFEAIGGTGKSILTWEWTTKKAKGIREDWAGFFWYSFYERGAIMADFCSLALSYITGRPLKFFQKKKTSELGELLIYHLKAKPWLIVCDGLERVLVAYHRIDAAQLADEDAGKTDEIAHRDPCSAIRPEDDELLRSLASAMPSKILLTSRLVPRVLLNTASQLIPGVLRERLPGLRPADAEELFRACGVTGDSQAIQDYLQRHCDCHPLVIGVLAGLVTAYLPDRGNFDTWVGDAKGGGQLNFANLDLTQKRNHIILAALDALDRKSLQLLSTLALLSEAVDYTTLCAINPHFPDKPKKVCKPINPQKTEKTERWELLSDENKEQTKQEFVSKLRLWEEYEQAMAARLESQEFIAAPEKLEETVRNLEHCGLLQYDHLSKRYDLHPVVRGVSAGMLQKEEKEHYGQKVVDHFAQKSHSPYEEAETLEDVEVGLNLVRTLLLMERHQQAYDAYKGDFSEALVTNLSAHIENLNLLRPFFQDGWDALPTPILGNEARTELANRAAGSLYQINDIKTSQSLLGKAMLFDLRREHWFYVTSKLRNFGKIFDSQQKLAKADLCNRLSMDLATTTESDVDIFRTNLDRFKLLSILGKWEDADRVWLRLKPPRHLNRGVYSFGSAEFFYARFHFFLGSLTEEIIEKAEQIARNHKDRNISLNICHLRGDWHLKLDQYERAEECFHEVVSRLNEVGLNWEVSEIKLAIAKFHLGRLPSPHLEAERLSKISDSNLELANLWINIGDHKHAIKHALDAYKDAWGDGEPYVYFYKLNEATALLEKLDVEIPKLEPYDRAKDEKLPWEDEVTDVIEKLYAEYKEKNAGRKNE